MVRFSHPPFLRGTGTFWLLSLSNPACLIRPWPPALYKPAPHPSPSSSSLLLLLLLLLSLPLNLPQSHPLFDLPSVFLDLLLPLLVIACLVAELTRGDHSAHGHVGAAKLSEVFPWLFS